MDSNTQPSGDNQAEKVPGGPHMHALKHGLRSRSILLPGEDRGAYDALHRSLTWMYRPATVAERRCVDRIAACEWRRDRYPGWQAHFEGRLQALMEDETGTVEQHCDPDPHRWQHRADDCTKLEGRMDRMMVRAERRLLELQRLRRQGLLAPGITAQHVESAEAAGQEPVLAAAESTNTPDTAPPVAIDTPPADPAAGPVTASEHGSNPKVDQRECSGGEMPVDPAPGRRETRSNTAARDPSPSTG